jgi:hypothetical protein
VRARLRRALARAFYGPPDWLAHKVTARTRRAVGFWLLVLWLGPGLAAWLMLREALWFIGFMSIFAIWWTGWAGVGTETPVEPEAHREE